MRGVSLRAGRLPPSPEQPSSPSISILTPSARAASPVGVRIMPTRESATCLSGQDYISQEALL